MSSLQYDNGVLAVSAWANGSELDSRQRLLLFMSSVLCFIAKKNSYLCAIVINAFGFYPCNVLFSTVLAILTPKNYSNT